MRHRTAFDDGLLGPCVEQASAQQVTWSRSAVAVLSQSARAHEEKRCEAAAAPSTLLGSFAGVAGHLDSSTS
jgi:hypothetical protein